MSRSGKVEDACDLQKPCAHLAACLVDIKQEDGEQRTSVDTQPTKDVAKVSETPLALCRVDKSRVTDLVGEAGRGVFATRNIPKNAWVARYEGYAKPLSASCTSPERDYGMRVIASVTDKRSNPDSSSSSSSSTSSGSTSSGSSSGDAVASYAVGALDVAQCAAGEVKVVRERTSATYRPQILIGQIVPTNAEACAQIINDVARPVISSFPSHRSFELRAQTQYVMRAFADYEATVKRCNVSSVNCLGDDTPQFCAIRDIAAGEELTRHYGCLYWCDKELRDYKRHPPKLVRALVIYRTALLHCQELRRAVGLRARAPRDSSPAALYGLDARVRHRFVFACAMYLDVCVNALPAQSGVSLAELVAAVAAASDTGGEMPRVPFSVHAARDKEMIASLFPSSKTTADVEESETEASKKR